MGGDKELLYAAEGSMSIELVRKRLVMRAIATNFGRTSTVSVRTELIELCSVCLVGGWTYHLFTFRDDLRHKTLVHLLIQQLLLWQGLQSVNWRQL